MAISADSFGQAEARERVRIALRLEEAVLWLVLFAQLLLRGLYLFHHRIDSDEPQHLHVVWGWTQGLVQYRDLFDNHAPLFHLLLAPFVLVFGERPDILVLARLMLLPLVALSLWATWHLGSRLWSREVGAWGAVLSGLAPTWLLTSVEFRADILWMAAWLCSLLVLLGGPFTPRRGFLGGLLLGAALVTSLKSVLLLIAFAMAGALVLVLGHRAGERWAPRRIGESIAWITAGLVILPIILLAAFWRAGALGALSYCTIQHNIVPGLGLWGSLSPRLLFLPATLLVCAPVARRFLQQRPDGLTERRVVFILTTALFIALLEGYWPLITREDYLPWIPMLTLVAVAFTRWGWSRIGRGVPGSPARAGLVATLTLVAAFEIVSVVRTEAAWLDTNQDESRLLGEVLRLTRAHEPIMDLKGETVFRPRPYYIVLEGVAKARIALGLLPDRIALDVERTRTHFAALDNRGFPPAGRRFLSEHFVPAGSLRVLGVDLGDRPAAGKDVRAFDVSYPERFAIIADRAPGRGNLDGVPYREPRALGTGTHIYRPGPGESRVVVVWQGAIERDPALARLPWTSR